MCHSYLHCSRVYFIFGFLHTEMMQMKRISILPLISTFVVCAVFAALSMIQFQLQNMLVSVPNS